MIALAAGALVYAVLVVAASLSPGPRGWGVHAPGFLPLPLRIAILGALLSSVTVLVLAAYRRDGPDRPAAPQARPDPKSRTRAWLPALLLPLALALWLLRARTTLLGDGAVWLATVQSGERRAYSEPLSAALWHGFGHLLRLFGKAPDALSMSFFSVLCGVAAVPILAGIAVELEPRGRWITPFALLLTLGISQLYFGYIESYPASAVFILLYLWLALRRARGADPAYLVAAALALASAAHLSALYLAPSYLLLAWLTERPLARRAALLALPFAFLVALLLALGYPPSQWMDPLRAATSGIREGFAAATLRRPYGFFSYGHLADVLNIVLLAMPVPALLLLGWAVATRGRFRPFSRDMMILAAAAIPGFLLAAWLMTPVAPAQDWDLTSTLLLPAAVFGVAAGRRLVEGRAGHRIAAGLVGISACSLLSFVSLNASERASVARLTAIASDAARVSPYGRAYASSGLELHFRDRGQNEKALAYARATLAAEPTNPRHWTNVGHELMTLGRFEEAIPFFREAARRGPGRWQGQYDLGLCYMNLGRYSEATSSLREAVRLEGNQPLLRHHLGIALYRGGHPDSALVVWREILARWPDYAASLQIPSK